MTKLVTLMQHDPAEQEETVLGMDIVSHVSLFPRLHKRSHAYWFLVCILLQHSYNITSITNTSARYIRIIQNRATNFEYKYYLHQCNFVTNFQILFTKFDFALTLYCYWCWILLKQEGGLKQPGRFPPLNHNFLILDSHCCRMVNLCGKSRVPWRQITGSSLDGSIC